MIQIESIPENLSFLRNAVATWLSDQQNQDIPDEVKSTLTATALSGIGVAVLLKTITCTSMGLTFTCEPEYSSKRGSLYICPDLQFKHAGCSAGEFEDLTIDAQ